MREESALLAGISLSPENMEQVLNAPLQTRLLMNRFRQLVTSLNFAIQTTPLPGRGRSGASSRASTSSCISSSWA